MNADSICAWLIKPGISWIQTREPGFARKLSRRRDTRLVAVSVGGGFMRIYEMRRSPSLVQRLIKRFVVTNARFSSTEASPRSQKPARTVATAEQISRRTYGDTRQSL
jgi:hypothetical protein